MSGPREMAPWSKPLEVDRLAESQADLDYEIELAELPGLRSLRGGVAGKVAGRVHFGRRSGTAVAALTLDGTATLQCQRCMQPLQLPLQAASGCGAHCIRGGRGRAYPPTSSRCWLPVAASASASSSRRSCC